MQCAAWWLTLQGGSAPAQGKHGQVRPSNSEARPPPSDNEVVVAAKPSDPALATLATGLYLKGRGVSVKTQQFWHSTLKSSPPAGFQASNRYTETVGPRCRERLADLLL